MLQRNKFCPRNAYYMADACRRRFMGLISLYIYVKNNIVKNTMRTFFHTRKYFELKTLFRKYFWSCNREEKHHRHLASFSVQLFPALSASRASQDLESSVISSCLLHIYSPQSISMWVAPIFFRAIMLKWIVIFFFNVSRTESINWADCEEGSDP